MPSCWKTTITDRRRIRKNGRLVRPFFFARAVAVSAIVIRA
jgi:hypothetical protein